MCVFFILFSLIRLFLIILSLFGDLFPVSQIILELMMRRFISDVLKLKDLTVFGTSCPFGRRFISTSFDYIDLTVFCTYCPLGIYANMFPGGYFLCVHCAYVSGDKSIAGVSLLVQKKQGSFLSHRHMIRGLDLSRLILSARFHRDSWQIVNGLGLTTCLVLSHPLGSTLGLLFYVLVFIFQLVGWAWKMPRYCVLSVYCRTYLYFVCTFSYWLDFCMSVLLRFAFL